MEGTTSRQGTDASPDPTAHAKTDADLQAPEVFAVQPGQATAVQVFAGLAGQVVAVRAFVRKTLADPHFKAAVEDVELLATELVTNSIRYSRSRDTGTVRVMIVTGETVRVEVQDDGSDTSVPTAGTAGPMDVTGRGLMLVEALSTSFGVRVEEHSTTTWFESTP
ncbi:ATP-binding protein [Sphaerisporangium corydalis]|uniref:ATP-binding protein n=1 Tax=Sphaerisporangium corydalis TaxID=1441875 RepID=A0ABV9EFD1_9ACTN|nr:ATP-binding protein [Sphaerisporangium corydalis]